MSQPSLTVSDYVNDMGIEFIYIADVYKIVEIIII
jgi:hypothetical protein